MQHLVFRGFYQPCIIHYYTSTDYASLNFFVFLSTYVSNSISEQRQSCEACIGTKVCMTSANKAYLNFSILFERSALDGDCELLLNGDTMWIINEERCVEVHPNTSSYLIRCPICNQHDISHSISNEIFSNIPFCTDSGLYCNIF